MIIEPNSVYTPQQVAELLACSKSNVYDLMTGGQLARVAIGAGQKGFRVLGSDLLTFVESRREGGPQPQGSFKHLKAKLG